MNKIFNFLRLEGSPSIENSIKMDHTIKMDEDLMNSIRQMWNSIKSDLLKPVSDGFKSVSDWFTVCALASMGAFTIGYYGSKKNVKMERCMFVSSLVGIGSGLLTQKSIGNLNFFSVNVAFGLATGLFVCLLSYKQ